MNYRKPPLNKMRYSLPSIFALVIFLSCTGEKAWAQLGGNSPFSYLRIPVSAREAALGTVNITSQQEDISMALSNPALMDSTLNGRLMFQYQAYLAGISDFSVAYGIGSKWGGDWFAGLRYLDYGQFDGFDNTGASTASFTGNNFILQGGYARAQGNFRMGVQLKLAGSQLDGDHELALLGDLAVAFIHPSEDLKVALMVKNIGAFLQHYPGGVQEEMPWDLLLGASFKPEHMPFRFSLTANRLNNWNITYYEPPVNTSSSSVFDNTEKAPGTGEEILRHLTLGSELILNDHLQFRIGYNYLIHKELKLESGGGGSGLTLGLLFGIKRFQFSYSRLLYHAASASNFVQVQTNIKEFF